jgi:hypothetical protein
MCKKTLRACRNKADFIGYARYKKARIVQGTHGVKIYGPKPGYAVLHANHTKELATGTRAALIRTLIAIGLGVFVIIMIVIVVKITGYPIVAL